MIHMSNIDLGRLRNTIRAALEQIEWLAIIITHAQAKVAEICVDVHSNVIADCIPILTGARRIATPTGRHSESLLH